MKKLLALATLGLLLQASAQAGQVQVSVTAPDGQPVADVAVMVHPTAAWAAQPLPEPVLIAQRNIRFAPFVTVVPVGATVRFVNQDRFDHHVRSQPGGPLGNVPPAKQFEFRMAGAAGGKDGTAADLKMDVPGIVALGCHLHGSMRGHVVVSTTPWYAVTDDKGVATIANVPDGQVEVKLWHPEQLTEQAATRVQVAGNANADTKLNFAPRRRNR
ncbi:plastocyanin [Aquincola sp. S2]|uniref:Plastocyanin n=1 Tax=Pseudaquabacterium terrae TaxID=2732868 RepID=A0ABX2EQ84_9BURK|nr:plastocyanin [Aquabacterium terrae]NRF70834.1 plastocyanin [Aquabacterium terrae]